MSSTQTENTSTQTELPWWQSRNSFEQFLINMAPGVLLAVCMFFYLMVSTDKRYDQTGEQAQNLHQYVLEIQAEMLDLKTNHAKLLREFEQYKREHERERQTR